MEEINQKAELIKSALVSIGFTEYEAARQVDEIGKVIMVTVYDRLFREKDETRQLSSDELRQFVDANFTSDYIQKVVAEESSRLVGDYLNEITLDLSEEKRQAFFNKIGQIAG